MDSYSELFSWGVKIKIRNIRGYARFFQCFIVFAVCTLTHIWAHFTVWTRASSKVNIYTCIALFHWEIFFSNKWNICLSCQNQRSGKQTMIQSYLLFLEETFFSIFVLISKQTLWARVCVFTMFSIKLKLSSLECSETIDCWFSEKQLLWHFKRISRKISVVVCFFSVKFQKSGLHCGSCPGDFDGAAVFKTISEK